MIQNLLQKYQLHLIPLLREQKKKEEKQEIQELSVENKKIHWKKRLIHKKKKSSNTDGVRRNMSEDQLLTRKIYHLLMSKLNESKLCKTIAISLKEQISR